MEIKKINNEFYVSVQISASNMQSIKKQGIKTIICNRPDNEEEKQPLISEIIKSANEYDIEVKFLPVVSGNVSNEQIHSFSQLLAEVNQPVLAYCRTGTRSTILWTLSQAGKSNFARVLESTKNAGYDLAHLESRFDELSSK